MNEELPNTSLEFQAFPKMARLSRNCTVLEKIDGTNAQVLIAPFDDLEYDDVAKAATTTFCIERGGKKFFISAGSRNRWLTEKEDNYGFCKWVGAHLYELVTLGPGRHFGEWWGSGIQRGYGLVNGDKRFSLFNPARYAKTVLPACVGTVPTLYEGLFSTAAIDYVLGRLAELGSVAAPGFKDPEGLIIYHEAARVSFKKTIKDDASPKSLTV